MSSKYPRQAVSEEVCLRVLNRLLRCERLGKGGMLDVRKGTGANELIMVTMEGEVPCRVMEDDIFIIFEMPSGQNDLCAPKREFLEMLAEGDTPNRNHFDGKMRENG